VGTCDVEPTRFEVGGELFTVASARSRRKLKRLARDAHGAVTVREDFEAQISFIGSLLIESDQSRWHNLCERTEDPVPAFLFPRIFDWLLEVVEPEFAQTLPKATARFNRRVEAHLRRWTPPSFELRSASCSWSRTQGRTTRTRRRVGTACRVTRAGPGREPAEPHPLARPLGGRRGVPGGGRR
jgi:hypothetical protein